MNVFSIDIAITAVSGYLAVNKAFQTQSDNSLCLLLFFAVLLVYWFDHILDIKKYGASISSRHQVFAQKSKVIYALGLLFLMIACYLSYVVLTIKVLFYGLLIGALCVVYLFFNRYKWLNKELIAASIYAAGIYFQILLRPSLSGVIAALLFWGITYYTMMGIAELEHRTDSYFGIPNNFKLNWLQNHLFELLILGAVLLLFSFYHTSIFSLIFSYTLMLLCLKLLFNALKKNHFLKENYRITIEWLFLLPWIFA